MSCQVAAVPGNGRVGRGGRAPSFPRRAGSVHSQSRASVARRTELSIESQVLKEKAQTVATVVRSLEVSTKQQTI